MQVQLADNP